MRLRIGRTAAVVARINRPGRALLNRALRERRSIALRVRVSLPGARAQVRRLTLRP